MIAWVALAAYLLLAIGTYSVGDPGWSSTGNGAGISNSAGSAGAWIADVLLSLFGYVAYLFPVLLGYRAWALVRDRQSPFVFDWLLVSIRSVGFVLVVLAGTGLLAIKGSATTLLPFGIGGMLGETLAQPRLRRALVAQLAPFVRALRQAEQARDRARRQHQQRAGQQHQHDEQVQRQVGTPVAEIQAHEAVVAAQRHRRDHCRHEQQHEPDDAAHRRAPPCAGSR